MSTKSQRRPFRPSKKSVRFQAISGQPLNVQDWGAKLSTSDDPKRPAS